MLSAQEALADTISINNKATEKDLLEIGEQVVSAVNRAEFRVKIEKDLSTPTRNALTQLGYQLQFAGQRDDGPWVIISWEQHARRHDTDILG